MKAIMVYMLLVISCLFSFTKQAPLERHMVDMTYVYNENMQHFPVWKKFRMDVVINGTMLLYQDPETWIQGEEIFTATHMGTHMDAPSHFTMGGKNVDEIDIETFIAPAAVINIANRATENPDDAVTVSDLEDWENVTGQTLDGKVVLINSGWGKKWLNRAEYIGNDEEDVSNLHFPGFSSEAAQWLVDNRNIVGIGSDTISFDVGNSHGHLVHKTILGHGLYGLENVANVDKIPIYGAILYIMPMKIGRASGAPTRIIAIFPKVIFD